MLCRIATPSQPAEPVAWRNVDGEQPLKYARYADTRLTDPGFAARQADALERRLLELQGTHQTDTACARQSGFDEGVLRGREESAAELQKALDQLARTITDLAGQKKKIRREAERELVKLSLDVARRILHRELVADPESIQGIVFAALQKLQNREISRVRVYPAGVAAVRSAMERIGHRNEVEIAADPMLQPGTILFETSLGELDASIETQLQEIERGFADRLALP